MCEARAEGPAKAAAVLPGLRRAATGGRSAARPFVSTGAAAASCRARQQRVHRHGCVHLRPAKSTAGRRWMRGAEPVSDQAERSRPGSQEALCGLEADSSQEAPACRLLVAELGQ